ncbi:hypothetical protein F5887DRAFT_1077664 [Amanita rubescens]|nr:hypothetical protein F5887DRAFT_1077664 [Amanita rubescens]
MINHLLSCNRVPEDVKMKMKALKGKQADSEDDEVDGDLGAEGVAKQRKFTVIAAKAISFNNEKQLGFEGQLLRACISAGWSFNSIMDPEVRKLFAMIAPGAIIPDCNKLSGMILHREVTKIEGGLREQVKKEYATLQCDGWKDISKNHLIAFMFTAKQEFTIYISAQRKTGENLAVLIKEELENLRKLGAHPIRVVGDASGNERKAQQLVSKDDPSLLIADCTC